MRWRGRALVTTVAVATVVATALPASAANPRSARPNGPSARATADAATAFTVTLVTGDRVQVRAAGGTYSAVISPGSGRKNIAFIQQPGKDAAGHDTFQVLPVDALRLVQSGRLDARLFDVLKLKQFGYDDAHSASTPLIVTTSGSPGLAAAKLAGARTTRTLASIRGAAVTSAKKNAVAFWRSLHTSGAGLAAGVTNVYLDGKSRLLDEESNKQIGAPDAWAAGYDGTGVTAAVLDSGIDATHPDLKDKIAEAVDFTGSDDGAKDDHGHGTHVAATIAGTGAASGGKHSGVAPGAKLLIGRVCDQWGSCTDSATLAGMEWAASKARVISMSLGTSDPSDGQDLISQAVNKLSADTGTLFVIAAGNSGPDAGSVGSPGAADAALTVGSVGRTDVASDFSSRGPRKDGAVKPDITAPGEDIISARAAGTEMGDVVDDNYTAASGTSMATPHVSGAAAVLAQAHPTWSGAQLKAALTASALPNLDLPFVQGAGRLDLARAVGQQVYTGPSLNLGRITAPFGNAPVVRKTVTYHNAGASAVTLTLDASAGIGETSAESVPDGALTLSAKQVTVPAGGEASVEVALDPTLLDATIFGALSGRIVATDGAGTTVQTVFGGIVEPESYDVTFDLIDRHGKPITVGDGFEHTLALYTHDLAVAPDAEANVDSSTVTVRAQKGRYGLASMITTAETEDNEYGTESFTFLTIPTLTVDRDLKITLDARTGKPIRPVLDAANVERKNAFVEQLWTVHDGDDIAGVSGQIVGTGSAQPFYVRTTGSDPDYKFLFRGAFGTPAGVSPAHLYHLAIKSEGRAPDGIGRIRDRDLATVRARYRAQGLAAVGQRAEWVQWYEGQGGYTDLFVDNIPLPSRLTEHYSPGDVKYRGLMEQRSPSQPWPAPEGTTLTVPRSYHRGAVTSENWNAAVLGPNLGDEADPVVRIARDGDRIFAFVPLFATPEPGHSTWVFGENFSLRGSTTLRKDGVQVGRGPFPGFGGFDAPTAEDATYELEIDAQRPYRWTDIASKLNVKWTFNSAGTKAAENLPLQTVRITAPLLDDYNAASGGSYFPVVLRVETQHGVAPVPVKAVTLEYSTDDGVTWTPVRVYSRGGYYGALLENPVVGANGGYVSLRVKATNTAGGSVVQTHIRAYKLTAE